MSELKALESAYILGLVDEEIAEEGIKDKLKMIGDKGIELLTKGILAPVGAALWLYDNSPKERAKRKEKEAKDAEYREKVSKMPTVSFEEFKTEYYPKYKACIKEMKSAFNSLHKSNKISEHSKLLSWVSKLQFSEVDDEGYPWPPHVVFMEYNYPDDLGHDEMVDMISDGSDCILINKMIKIANKHGMDIDYHYADGIPYEWYIEINNSTHNFSTIDNDKLQSLKL